MRSILVIQTAFIGDVVLATALLESLHKVYPQASIDIAVRKGNELMFNGHPFLRKVLIWNKQQAKYRNLIALLKEIRQNKYSLVINLQRYAATGFLTAFSGAETTIGFNKNPFHFLFTHSIKHQMGTDGQGGHETKRNHQLIASLTSLPADRPALYPSAEDDAYTAQWKRQPYICIAPTSVWFTKQFPAAKWVELLNALPEQLQVYLLGGPGDREVADEIIAATKHRLCTNLSGKCNFLQSASLMRDARMNYVNDSAPMHFCSSVNAPVTAVYCSTVPAFGYGPLSDNSRIVETTETLSCRPCGLHGRVACPLGHFNCANTIRVDQLTAALPS